MWMVVSTLGPLYAILFGLVALRELLDRTLMKTFSSGKKSKSKSTRPRQSVFYDRSQYPGLRYHRTKKGLRVSWYA